MSPPLKSLMQRLAPVGRFLDRHLFSVAGIGAVLLVYFFFYGNGAFVRVQFEAADSGTMRLYWNGPDRGFAPEKENAARYQAGVHDITVPVGRIPAGGRLRIDPLDEPGVVRILSVTLDRPFARPLDLSPGSDASGPGFRLDGDWVEVPQDGRGLLLLSDGADPQLVWEDIRMEGAFLTEPSLWFLLLLAAALVLFERLFPVVADAFVRRLQFVPAVMLVALAGQLAVALVSPGLAHPDEPVHLMAGGYYEDHWLLPRADDPGIRGSYSAYGFSRLNMPEVGYFLAGKFSAATEWLGIEDSYIRLRLFNVLLFGLLTLSAILVPRFRILLLPLILTPQVWYLFSYFNSDAFALAVCFPFFFACVAGMGPIRRLFRGEWEGSPARLVAAGALLALPFGLLKMNFWFIGGFIVGYLVVQSLWTPPGRRRAALVGLGLVLLAPVAANLAWRFASDWRNDFRRAELMEEMRNRTAEEIYHPDTPLEKIHYGLYLKDRGVAFHEIFTRKRWHEIVVGSSLGNYGWFGIRPSPIYYDRASAIFGLFFLMVLVPAVFRMSLREGLILAGAIFSCLVMVLISALHSWMNDFQAQGRYLAPILPIVGVALFEIRRRVFLPFFVIPVGALVLLGIYSFFFIALPGFVDR